jgi:hypothetical protein
VGVFEVDKANEKIRSVGAVRLKRLDYVAFGRTTVAGQALLEQYVNGEITFEQLTAGLEATP